jgi:hypothetical protein
MTQLSFGSAAGEMTDDGRDACILPQQWGKQHQTNLLISIKAIDNCFIKISLVN